jgi:phosphoribosyl 1,2-cyclic phosphate phosphodiesterase
MLHSTPVRVVFLGTGTSHGVPMIGCDCGVCRSTDPRDQRSRPSVYIECDDGTRLLVDTTPDLRLQALRHNLRRVDAILFTHAHADHIMGLDEIRRFNVLSGGAIAGYGDAPTIADLQRVFGYAFDPDLPPGGGVPDLRLAWLAGPCCIGRQEIVPVPVRHGVRTIYGFRVGGFAYLTDCSAVPDASRPLLAGIDTLVIDALRRRPHPTHLSLDQAIAEARRLGARATYFTHIAHDLGHAATCAALPAGMSLAYDGLTLTIEKSTSGVN